MRKYDCEIQEGAKQGEDLGLTQEELAFYDALTKPEAIKDFYENEELVALTRELTETLRKNKTIDWQKRNTARARMRMMIKRLLKKYKYPPEGMDDALETVMTQCELWTDNNDMETREPAGKGSDSAEAVKFEPMEGKGKTFTYEPFKPTVQKVAEPTVPYGHKHPGVN